MQSADRPQLSVIVAATGGRAATQRLLTDLASQARPPSLEVIVVDGTGQLDPADLGPSPGLQPQLVTARGADVAELRARGARRARGGLLAFTEDLCRIPPDWCERLQHAYVAGYRAFGGAIENGSYRSAADWAAYFVEFGPFMPPLVEGPADRLPGMNVVYERDLVEDLIGNSLCEPIVNAQLRSSGISLHNLTDFTVVLEHRFGVANFARHCFCSGRTFARLRLAGTPGVRRIVYAAGAAVALPLVLTGRTSRHAFARRWARGPLLRAAPWVALYSTAWALGEAIGALASPSGEA
jgi:hypothetical protein